MPSDRQPDFDPAEAALIRIKARMLVERGLIPRGDVSDARQDLALALLAARPTFDTGRGTATGYAATVVARAAFKVARGRLAAKRHAGRVVALAAPDELVDTAGDPTARAALAADLATVVAALPPHLRAVAEALKGGTVAATARALGVPRTTVYERVREIYRRFERAGFGAG